MFRKLFFVLFLSHFFLNAQTYNSLNISLLSHIDPQTTVGIGTDGRKYSGCWGWFQANKNKEYAIIGTSANTFFVDVTNPNAPVVCDTVPGRIGCTWREMKTYDHYCYIVSDDSSPNRFQIVDMQYLPDSVHVVLDDNTSYFDRGHTIWIDKDRMYIGSQTKLGGDYDNMTVYSLATPSVPVFLRSLKTDYSNISVVHDMFVKNDTVYASCGNQGLFVYHFKPDTTFEQIGSFENYNAGPAYNHSSYITTDSKYLVFADEVPTALPLRIIDLQNMSNIVQTATANIYAGTTPHNPYVIGTRWAIVSSYQDGLIIYDIADKTNPIVSGYFDTHNQGGFENGYPGSPYRGNWGAYPFLPSGIIIACDMQNGVFILDPSATYAQPIGLQEGVAENVFLDIFPNPATEKIRLICNLKGKTEINITNILGEVVLTEKLNYFNACLLNISDLSKGAYFVTVSNNNKKITKKIIKN